MSEAVAAGEAGAGRWDATDPPGRMSARPSAGHSGLRAALLAARREAAAADRFGDALAAFLTTDAGALSLWFGADAAALRRNPERLRGLIERDLLAIDRLLSAQLDAVLHQSRLQRLEGSWRGLAWLVGRFAPDRPLKVRLLTASWRELERDVTRTIEFDQSQLFRKIYENEFGQAGGEPFGLLVVDHEVRHRPEPRAPGAVAPVDDVIVMGALAEIAAAAFVPTVLAVSPALLGVDRFADLTLSQDVAAASAVTTRALACPHAAGRGTLPLRDAAADSSATALVTRSRQPLLHRGRSRGGGRVWFVAGYAFAATVGRAFLSHGWPADVRGVGTDRVGGGLVLDLPQEDFVLGAGTRWARASVDLALTDQQERDLVEAGLMPLKSLPYGDAAFASVRSLQASAAEAPGRDPSRSRRTAHFGADQCHAVRLALRPLREGSRPGADRLHDGCRRYRAAARAVAGGVHEPDGRLLGGEPRPLPPRVQRRPCPRDAGPAGRLWLRHPAPALSPAGRCRGDLSARDRHWPIRCCGVSSRRDLHEDMRI